MYLAGFVKQHAVLWSDAELHLVALPVGMVLDGANDLEAASRGLDDWGVFDREHLRWMLGELRGGGGRADAGLFFRAAVLGLWLNSLGREARC